MPGHIDCCWQPIAQWLAQNLPGVKINLRSGFWPAWHSASHPELQRTLSVSETSHAEAIARQYELNLIP
jgi:putative pyruvate formate lyase activating enzyme